jgi:hypothetical protein
MSEEGTGGLLKLAIIFLHYILNVDHHRLLPGHDDRLPDFSWLTSVGFPPYILIILDLFKNTLIVSEYTAPSDNY